MATTKLKIAILGKGLTQRELSRRVGIHESIISLVVTGRCVPDPTQEALMSKAVCERQGELLKISHEINIRTPLAQKVKGQGPAPLLQSEECHAGGNENGKESIHQ